MSGAERRLSDLVVIYLVDRNREHVSGVPIGHVILVWCVVIDVVCCTAFSIL